MRNKLHLLLKKMERKCRKRMACICHQEQMQLRLSWGSQGTLHSSSKNDEVKQTTVSLFWGKGFSSPIKIINWEKYLSLYFNFNLDKYSCSENVSNYFNWHFIIIGYILQNYIYITSSIHPPTPSQMLIWKRGFLCTFFLYFQALGYYEKERGKQKE